MLVFEILIKERECHALASRIEVLGRSFMTLSRARMHRETLIQGTALTGIVKDKFTM